MKRILLFLAICTGLSCNRNSPETGTKIITVSIAPYSYFIKEIAGDDFRVNIMVPPGSNPHIYEPYPGQISRLRKSVAYVSNGFLGFEMTWLHRFYELNKTMIKLSLGDKIDRIASSDNHEGEHSEGTDPHYWVSPSCALVMASEVKELLYQLNPSEQLKYQSNYDSLTIKIKAVDLKAKSLFASFPGESFMIYHPNLAYLARDYGLNEIAVEFEGKEPPPSRFKELIDIADISYESDINKETKKLEDNLEKLKLRVLFCERFDSTNAILEINSGAGGTEACDWASILFRMYFRFAEENKFKLKYRLPERTYGIYDGNIITEIENVVVGSSYFNFEDYLR